MNSARLFTIYLRDHQAAATGGLQLIRRIAHNNAGNEFGHQTAAIAEEIAEERALIERLMDQLGIKPSILKQGVTWMGEKLARLKLNGHVFRYSPLSRVLEIEGMSGAIRAKMRLWSTLGSLQPFDSRLKGFDFEGLLDQGREQYRQLIVLHQRAIHIAFVGQKLLTGSPPWDAMPAGEPTR